jgi:hypothetical protein
LTVSHNVILCGTNYFVAYPLDSFLAEIRKMARIPENEIERLRSEVSVERLVEASGIDLVRGGKDLWGAARSTRTTRPVWW